MSEPTMTRVDLSSGTYLVLPGGIKEAHKALQDRSVASTGDPKGWGCLAAVKMASGRTAYIDPNEVVAVWELS